MEELLNRQTYTEDKTKELRFHLSEKAAHLVKGKACVYATGSFGRREASEHSDLDLFIIAKTQKTEHGKIESLLTRLHAICLQADLIRVAEELKFPEFSGDGEFLTHHSVDDFTKTLGTPQDDLTNTFTARLLLLLESKPLLEDTVYDEVVRKVVDSYWRDFNDHSNEFMPVFLANDIIRLWRTFCVNYEAKKNLKAGGGRKAKERLRNYKLKHSRVMTCYSALCWLLYVYKQNKTVTDIDAFNMTNLTPTERIEYIQKETRNSNTRCVLGNLLAQYESFLQKTHMDEKSLLEIFADKDKRISYKDDASVFGDLMFKALRSIGDESPFYRHLVV